MLSSRVLEKPALFSVAILWDVLKKELDISGTASLHIWSDTGPHFRAWRFLGSVGILMAQHFSLNVTIQWGCEHHMKHLIDGYFARQNLALALYSKHTTVTTIADMIAAYEKNFADRQVQAPGLIPEKFIEYMPPERHTVLHKMMKQISGMPCLSQSHCWEFQLLRKDRASAFGRAPRNLMATNIRAFARFLSDGVHAEDVEFTPIVFADEAVAGEEVQLITENEVLLTETSRVHHGWRCSYRKDKPETWSYAATRPRLQRKTRVLSPMLGPTEALRHKSIDTLRAASVASMDKRKLAGRLKTAELAKYRKKEF